MFLDVGQIVAGYSFQRSVNASATISEFFRGPSPHTVTSVLKWDPCRGREAR